MKQQWCKVLTLVGLLAAPFFMAVPTLAQESQDNRQSIPEEIVVKGRLPGPPLWRVTNGDNVLWIFPSLSPVPEDMQWDSERVTEIIAASRVFIAAPRAGIDSAMRRGNFELPEKQTLQDVLPAELYARYRLLVSDFPSRRLRAFERLQPFAAGPSLLNGMLQEKGLGDAADIMRVIERAVRRNRDMETVEIVNVAKLDRGEREALVAEMFDIVPEAQGIACFESVLDRIAPEVDARISRANTWASGDIDALREIELPETNGNPCTVALPENQQSTELLASMYEKTFHEWQAAAEQALLNHASSFAVLSLDELLKEDGLLSVLRTKGYTVIEPW